MCREDIWSSSGINIVMTRDWRHGDDERLMFRIPFPLHHFCFNLDLLQFGLLAILHLELNSGSHDIVKKNKLETKKDIETNFTTI